MRWLVWKDFRLNRPIFIVALFMLIMPFALTAILNWRGVQYHVADYVMGWIWCDAIMLQLAITVLGGNLIAGERNDRSAEFLAYLPVSPGRKLASKLLVALALILLAWLPIVVSHWMYQHRFGPPTSGVHDTWPELGVVASIGLMCFSVAFLFSSFLESPTFSAFAGVAAPFLVFWSVWLLAYCLGPDIGRALEKWFPQLWFGLCLAISAASFTGGTLYYLRRVEP
jgi:ABC-type transport system involved in multi-copper enzyme maturation permease subunit